MTDMIDDEYNFVAVILWFQPAIYNTYCYIVRLLQIFSGVELPLSAARVV